MAIEKSLATRKATKKKKPIFRRSQVQQFAKFAKSGWRSPKGMGNKLRRRWSGRIMPSVGFKSPADVRGFNHNGLREILVNNVADLSKVKAKDEIAVLASNVGGRKRLLILAEAKKKGIKVANAKNIDEAIKKLTKVK